MMQMESRSPVSKSTLWAGRIISALPVLLLLYSAEMKLSRSTEVLKGMADLGWPDRLLLTLAIVEIACTVLYVLPQTAVLGAILLTGYLGGATATHARLLQPGFFLPVMVGVLLWLGLFLRDPRLRTLIPIKR